MKVAIVTISDGCFSGVRADLSGDELVSICQKQGWANPLRRTVPDELPQIRRVVEELLEAGTDLILTTGGTGLGPRDVTPEALLPLLEKPIPGMGELMRSRGLRKTVFAAISRSFAGAIAGTLIIALPGSPQGASESLEAVLPLIPHLHDLLQGRTRHGKA